MNEFDDLDDLDEVFGPLRSPAQPAELSRESATVDFMVNARHHSEEKHMFTSRSARIATLVAAGVLGFGGMAAASSPGFLGGESLDESIVVQQAEEEQDDEEQVPEDSVPEDSVPEDSVPEDSVPEDSVPEDSVVEEPAVERSVVEDEVGDEEPSVVEDDPDTDFNEEYCEEGNHGKTVSAVARGVFDSETYNAANDLPLTVKMAAQSSCGKMGDDLDADDLDEIQDEIDDEDDTSEVEESKADKAEKSEAKAERPGKSDKGADKAAKSKGNGNGNGKSNGKRGG